MCKGEIAWVVGNYVVNENLIRIGMKLLSVLVETFKRLVWQKPLCEILGSCNHPASINSAYDVVFRDLSETE